MNVDLQQREEELDETRRDLRDSEDDVDYWRTIAICFIIFFLLALAVIAYMYVKYVRGGNDNVSTTSSSSS